MSQTARIVLEDEIDSYVLETAAKIVNLVCYHITNNYDDKKERNNVYVQFLMLKLPYSFGIIDEKFVLPYFTTDTSTKNEQLENMVKYISNLTSQIGVDCTQLSYQDCFHGITEDGNQLYAFFDLSSANIEYLHLSRNSNCWFISPTEILNRQEVCGFPVDKDLIRLFSRRPDFYKLVDENDIPFSGLPDVVYTAASVKKAEFMTIFGNVKTKAYDNCEDHFYFYSDMGKAVESQIQNTQSGGTDRIGINRHMVFLGDCEGLTFNQNFQELGIKEACKHLNIILENPPNGKPDILIRKYEDHYSLSFHEYSVNQRSIV